MSLIELKLQQFFLQYPEKCIVVAYSGGVDSQVLLHALARLVDQKLIPNKLRAIHVHHGLSRNADNWLQAAQKTCLQLNVPLTICQVNIGVKRQQSIEALARTARYNALSNSAPKNALIVTGHHSDDQSETLLLALKRGAGIKGLSSMSEVLAIGKQFIVRPLLSVTRKVIEDYAITNQLSWVEDESNDDLRFDRNFLRHQVLPILNDRWPSMHTTMARSAQHCQEAQLLLNELAQQDLLQCQLSDDSLSITQLLQLSQARFNNLIRFYLQTHLQLMPSVEQLHQLYLQLTAPCDKNPSVKMGKIWFRRYQNGLYLTKEFQDLSKWSQTVNFSEQTDEQNSVMLPDGLGELSFKQSLFDSFTEQGSDLSQALRKPTPKVKKICQYLLAPDEHQQLSIRFFHQNPTCLPDFRQHSRSLKKILQELHIAPWQRQRIPFIFYDDQLVAALGYFVCKDYLPARTTPVLTIKWLDESPSG